MANSSSVISSTDAVLHGQINNVRADAIGPYGDERVWPDGIKAKFGTGEDGEIYHDGSDWIFDSINGEDILLKISGTTRLAITSTGLSVTGTLAASGAIALVPTSRLRLDGMSGHTYFSESSADVFDLVVGGELGYRINAGGEHVWNNSGSAQTFRFRTANKAAAFVITDTLITSGLHHKLLVTDTDGTIEGSIWYDASDNKLKVKTASGVEIITSV